MIYDTQKPFFLQNSTIASVIFTINIKLDFLNKEIIL